MCIRDRLEVVGKQLDIPVFQMGQENPVTIAEAAIAHAKKHGNDMVFLDTAGRLHVDEALMEELQAICLLYTSVLHCAAAPACNNQVRHVTEVD